MVAFATPHMAKQNHRYNLGKVAVRHDARTLQLDSYLANDIAPPPASCDWASAVQSWPMDGNDTIGDCGPTSCAHQVQAWTKNEIGRGVVIPRRQVIQFYSDLSGYNPRTGRNDSGIVMLDMLNRWRHAGIGGHKIDSYVAVDWTDATNLQNAIYLFGGLSIGLLMPISAQNQTVWDVPAGGAIGDGVPGSWGGHAVPILGYSTVGETMYQVVSWNAVYTMTAAFLAAYCDEAYAALSPRDWVRTGHAPNGFNVTQLRADATRISVAA